LIHYYFFNDFFKENNSSAKNLPIIPPKAGWQRFVPLGFVSGFFNAA